MLGFPRIITASPSLTYNGWRTYLHYNILFYSLNYVTVWFCTDQKKTIISDLSVTNMSPIIPDRFPLDLNSGKFANLKYNDKVIFQFASVQDFIHFWSIFLAYRLERITALSFPITIEKLHYHEFYPPVKSIISEAYRDNFVFESLSFPGYAESRKIYTDYFHYPELLFDFQQKLDNLQVRRLFYPLHLPTYMFANYMYDRTIFTRSAYNLATYIPQLTTVELFHFFSNFSDLQVLIECLEIIGKLFLEYKLGGFPYNFKDKYLEYYGSEKLLAGDYSMYYGETVVNSLEIYMKLFESYFNSVLSEIIKIFP
jgi:hypothetical protein